MLYYKFTYLNTSIEDSSEGKFQLDLMYEDGLDLTASYTGLRYGEFAVDNWHIFCPCYCKFTF